MEQSTTYESNPWESDESSYSAINKFLLLARSTGHIRSNSNDDSYRDVVLADAESNFQSLKIMKAIKDVEKKRQQLDKMNLDIHKRLMDKETQDLTQKESINKRINDINKMNGHLQKIVTEKDQLIAKLQEPYVGEFLKIESTYKSYASEIFPMMVPILSDLSKELETIDWSSKINLKDGQLDDLLNDISSSLAALQSKFQGMVQMRQAMGRLYDQRLAEDVTN